MILPSRTCSLLLSATLLFASIFSASAADTKLNLTLPAAIRMALEQNLAIEVQSYSPLISGARLYSSRGKFDPTINATYNHSENESRFGSIQSAQTDVGRIGLDGLLPWGATYGLSMNTERTGGQSNSSNDWNSGAQFDLRQPLLQGFGTDVNMASIRIARKEQLQSEWAFRQQLIDTVTQVHLTYNQLFAAIEFEDVARRFQELANQLLQDNRKRVELGVMAPLDVTQAQAQVASRQEAVILAQRAVRDNENFLKQLVTNETFKLLAIDLAIAKPPVAVVGSLDVEQGLKDAFQSRPDYRQALLGLEQRHITVIVQNNQVLPQLDLAASLRALGLGSSLSSSIDRSVVHRDDQTWNAGVVFSLPIPNREARGRAKAARLEEVQALVNLKKLEQDIVVNVDNAAGQIVTTKERIKSTAESRRLAFESMQAAQERLKAGAGTTFEVLQLQRDLADAEASAVRARSDYNKAIAEYDRQTGRTLERNGVTLDSL